MRDDFNATIGNMRKEETFKQLRLNIWVNQRAVTWLAIAEWDKGNTTIDIEDLAGRECYGGLDIASTTDLAAFALLFPDVHGKDVILPFFWIPEQNMFERIKNDRIPYNKWVKEGYITATSGNVIDQDYIEREIIELSHKYDILEVGLDRYDSSMLRTHLEKNDINIVPVNQTMKVLSPTIKDVEINILSTKYQHGGNPVLRWCFGNIMVYRDNDENIKLNKRGKNYRIDGIDALVNAENRRTANYDEDAGRYYGGVSGFDI